MTMQGAAGTKRGAVILGMGRSGTSVTTNAFVVAGYYAGERDELLAGDVSNPLGYYEHLSVRAANEEILGAVGRYWFDPPSDDDLAAVPPGLIEQAHSTWRRLLDASPRSPVVIKDPRFGVLLPIWQRLLEEHLELVLVVRDPVEIAVSQQRREDVPVPCILAAWELHMKLLLRNFEGSEVTVVPHRLLLEQPNLAAETVQSVTERLAPPYRDAVDVSKAAQVVDQSLHRSLASSVERRQMLTPAHADLWNFLDGLAPGTQVLSAFPDSDDEQARATVKYWSDRYRTLTALHEGLTKLDQANRELHDTAVRLSETQRELYVVRADPIQNAETTHAFLRTLADSYVAQQRMRSRLADEMTAHYETTSRLADEMTAHYETTSRLADEMTAHHETTSRLADEMTAHHETTVNLSHGSSSRHRAARAKLIDGPLGPILRRARTYWRSLRTHQ